MVERQPQPIGVVARFWLAAIGVWGYKWTSHHGDLPVNDDGSFTIGGLLWARGLAEFSEPQITAAIERAITLGSEWPPNLPEMRTLCFGIPSLADVRDDATRAPEYRSAFTRLVWQHIDGFRYRQASIELADRMLRDAYELAREHVMRSGALPGDVAGELAHEKREVVPASPEVARAAMERIAAELGLPMTPPESPAKREGRPLAEVEAALQSHYSDRNTAAAGDV